MSSCSFTGCVSEARMAVRTRRPAFDRIESVIFYDDRTATQRAVPLCRTHGLQTVTELITTLVEDT